MKDKGERIKPEFEAARWEDPMLYPLSLILHPFFGQSPNATGAANGARD
jgi:hypothetical protein